jgi:hypothetical protein
MVDVDDDDFNSSDLEFHDNQGLVVAPPKRNPHAGAASIQWLRTDAFEDRINSKKFVKNLQFGRGAPGNVPIIFTYNVFI